jgi:hypothetical protein
LSHILTSRNFICSKYSRRIEVDILFPENLFATGNCDILLHIFVSKQFRTKPERYTAFLIDDKCGCYDRRLVQEEESVKWLGAAGHQGSVGVWGWKPNYLHQYYY